jgi:uncharacterized protein (DUF1330 family)
MSAYVILDITVHDPELFEQYKKLAPATISAYGGRYLTRWQRGSARRRLVTESNRDPAIR